MTCKDCIHFEACVDFWYSDYDHCTKEESIIKHANYPTCELFKPTADVVEVVRCKDCKYLYCLSAIDRRFYCRHHPHGLEGINIIEDNPYCSYGERREE